MNPTSRTILAGRYRVQKYLRREGLGEVFIAEDTQGGRRVAVKLLASDASEPSVLPGGEKRLPARFLQEGRALMSVRSDHLVPVLDMVQDEVYGAVIVFELREGEYLFDRLKRSGPMSIDALHPLIEQAWQGLADLHAAGIIHRDISPRNLLIHAQPSGRERLTLLHLGLCKLPRELGGLELTELGQTLGDFEFIAPEQIGRAKVVDARADIYACATVIFQALSGRLPYPARNVLVLVEGKCKTDASRLSDVMAGPVDPALNDFLARALARDPTARFESATAALAAWRQIRVS